MKKIVLLILFATSTSVILCNPRGLKKKETLKQRLSRLIKQTTHQAPEKTTDPRIFCPKMAIQPQATKRALNKKNHPIAQPVFSTRQAVVMPLNDSPSEKADNKDLSAAKILAGLKHKK